MKCALCGKEATHCYYGLFVCRPHLRSIMWMGYEDIKLLAMITSFGEGMPWFIRGLSGGCGQKIDEKSEAEKR